MMKEKRRFPIGKFIYYSLFGALCLTGIIILVVTSFTPHTIVFDSNGGTECNSIVTRGYEELELPTTTKDGMVFEGWFFGDYLGQEFKPDHYKNTRLEVDIIVYAKWADPKFDINFNSNGGSAAASIKTSGKELLDLPTPEMAGKKFMGWYFDNITFLNKLNANTYESVNLRSNLTVYAKWEEDLTLVGIQIVYMKNVYEVDDVIDLTGAILIEKYGNGSFSSPIAITIGMIKGFSTRFIGTNEMFILYKSFSESYEYTVNAKT